MRRLKLDPLTLNITLLVTMIMLFAMILNAILLRTEALGGISLIEYLADEYRIRFMSPPSDSKDCLLNRTHLLPNCSREFHGYSVRIPVSAVETNSFGIRDREYAPSKAPGTVRILAVGDSFTFGQGVGNDEVYTEILEEKLNTELDRQYEAFNLGMPGMSTDDEYRRLLAYWNYSPDLIILQVLQNDIYECGEIRAGILDLLGIRDQSPELFPTELFHKRSGEYLAGLDSSEACSCILAYAGHISEASGERGIPLIIYGPFHGSPSIIYEPVWGRRPERRCDFTGLMREGVAFVEAGPLRRRETISRMDPHPNAKGHRKMADELYPAVLESLGRGKS